MFEVLSYDQGSLLAVLGLIPTMFMYFTKENGLKLQILSVFAAFAGAFGLANALNVLLLS